MAVVADRERRPPADERVALKHLLDLDGLTAARRLVDDSGYAPS